MEGDQRKPADLPMSLPGWSCHGPTERVEPKAVGDLLNRHAKRAVIQATACWAIDSGT